MKLIIDRSKWLRGERYSYLLHPRSEKMCCLGFLALQCKLKPEDIEGVADPGVLTKDYQKLYPDWIFEGPYSISELTENLIKINDDLNLTNIERENEITRLFATQGIDVEFIN